MGGNIVDSASFRRAGTLLGPEGTAARRVSSVPGSSLVLYRLHALGVWGLVVIVGVRGSVGCL